MHRKPVAQSAARKDQQRRPERLEPWRNTKPRANPETNHGDLSRSIERFEMLLGR